MKKYNKFLLIFIFLNLFIFLHYQIYADEIYEIAYADDGKIESLGSFENYTEANSFYNSKINQYDNLVFLINGRVVKMEYGIVKFTYLSQNNDTSYISLINGDSYINSYYAADAAYISTDLNSDMITFKISGDIGNISLDSIELVPYECINGNVSCYSVRKNILYHDIKNNLDNNYYSSSIELDNRPEYLIDGERYYSYDGHYFYDSFDLMIDDYRNNTFDNSINKDNVYYNYYQFLPFRTYTNYNQSEIEEYFSKTLCFDGKIQRYFDLNRDNANDEVNLSQFYNEYNSFFGYGNIYGLNSMMLLSLSSHESSYGKSYSAFTNNNLFGSAAYDSENERSSSRYDDIDSSIYAFSKYYISRTFANVQAIDYRGSFFGNKLSGMNSTYSSDPYWGEKTASFYYRFDKTLGYKDLNSYSLGIINTEKEIKVYNDENLSELLFSLENVDDFSLSIIDENANSYKIQLDSCDSQDFLYDPISNIGYVSKDLFDIVFNKERIIENEFKTVSFDLDGGAIVDYNNIDIKVLKTNTPSLPNPKKEGFEFVGFDTKLSSTTNEYKAVYREIESIGVTKGFDNIIELGGYLDFNGGQILVSYVDGANVVKDINSNMIGNVNTNVEGDQDLIINYCGVSTTYPIHISNELKEVRNTLDNLIERNINSYQSEKTYSKEELDYIKNNLSKIKYKITFDQIRYLDAMLLEDESKKYNYSIRDSKFDISMSGFGLSLKCPDESTIYKPFKDTFYLSVNEIKSISYNRLKMISSSYGFDVVDSFELQTLYNLEDVELINPIIVEVKIPNKSQDKIYSVYQLDSNNNIIKCYTTQTNNYIQFICQSAGDFMVLSMDSINNYNFDDRYENIAIFNSNPDNHLLFYEGAYILLIGLFGFIMIILYAKISKKEEKLWSDYKRLLLKAELHREGKLKN